MFYLNSLCKVEWAKNGAEAIRMAELENYSIILADINLGSGMSGLDAIGKIRKINGYDDVIVVAVTAYALYGDKEKFLSQGCDFYISKPYEKSELVELLDKLLSQ
jgi:CheY-like chemotaxis protein